MYTVDARDTLTPLLGAPQAAVGAPLPIILAMEGALGLGFLREAELEEGFVGHPAAILVFRGVRSFSFGYPNDEAIAGHPLADRGLTPYSAYEVLDSSWVRSLEVQNRVHPRHDARHVDMLRHMILTFHDSTFECIALAFEVRNTTDHPVSLSQQLSNMERAGFRAV